MTDKPALIALRIFTGPNMGAEIMLPSGSYVMGRDTSCDIVLSDSSVAPRHATITVAVSEEEGQEPVVRLVPLEGKVTQGDTDLALEGMAVLPGTPWFLGLSCLAWNKPGQSREVIIPALTGKVQEAKSVVKEAEQSSLSTGSPSAASQSEGATALKDAARQGASEGVGGIQGTFWQKIRQVWPRWGIILALVFLLGVVGVSWRGPGAQIEKFADTLRSQIAAAGFQSLTVSSEDGTLAISGHVSNNQQWSDVLALAQKSDCPVYMRVGVLEDLIQAIALNLRSQGIHAKVWLSEAGEAVKVAAYIRDADIEANVFAELAKVLPDLPRFDKHIVYADALEGQIRQELNRQHLNSAQVRFGAGLVEISDTSSAVMQTSTHDALDAAMRAVEKQFGVPISYTIITQGGSPVFEGGGGDTGITIAETKKIPLADNPFSNVTIIGVTVKPLPFITLDNGQRVFEGGKLPGTEYVLEKIYLDMVTLQINGQKSIHPL